nr:unnamed protein product [Callosobruchus analis]
MSLGPKIIKFPDTTDKRELLAAEFLKIAGFRGVLGFLDAFTSTSSKMHDATVFQKSFIREKIMNLGNMYHIIPAYPISENLLTPYRDYGNLTPMQENYNYKFSKTRVLIENSFGLLKGRFRQLMKTVLGNNQAPADVPLYTEDLEIHMKQLGETERNTIARELME